MENKAETPHKKYLNPLLYSCGAVFVLLCFFSPSYAFAADRYWVGGTENWNGTAGSKWATTSGGAGGQTVPTSVDDCFFDAASGAVTVTIASGNTGCGNVTFAGFTGTLTGSTAITISGSLTMGSGMTNSYTGTITLNSTSGTQTITSNGITFGSSITLNGVGGTWQLADHLVMGSTRTLTLTNGTFDANDQDVTVGRFSSSNSSTRTLDVGSGTWTITGNNATVWTTSTVTGLTMTTRPTLNFNYSDSTGTRTIITGALSESDAPNINITAGSDTISVTQGVRNLVFEDGFSGTLSNEIRSISGDFTLSPNMTLASGSSAITLGALLSSPSWHRGALGQDGKIYGMPQAASDILIIDPSTHGATRSSLGADISGLGTSNKYFDAVTIDNKIYGVPHTATSILIIDTTTDTAELTSMGADLTGGTKWGGGVLGPDGKVYGIPWSGTDILIIDPTSGTATRSDMGADLSGAIKWHDGVLGPDGKIYGIPSSATDILIIDPTAGTATRSNMGVDLSGTGKWAGGVLGPDGKIYSIPSSATDILIIDPTAGTATRSDMGVDLSGTGKWNSGVIGSNGKIYGIPFGATDILIIDPAAGTATRSDMGVDLSGGSFKWVGGVLGSDNKIYAMPNASSNNILVIDPPSGVAYRSSLLSVSSGTRTITFNNQNINSPLTIDGRDGTFVFSDDFTTTSGLTIGGGTLVASTNMSIAGNFLHGGGSFTHNSGNVTLNGANQTISGNTSFYNLTKTISTADTLTFEASSTQTIEGALTLQGAANNLLSLRSSAPGTRWSIDPQGTRTLQYLDVQDSNNINALDIVSSDFNITNSGNNINWGFAGVTSSSGNRRTQSSFIPPAPFTPLPSIPLPTIIPGCNGTAGYSAVSGVSCAGNITNVPIITTPNLGPTILRNGSRGEFVKNLQIFLNQALNLGLIVDGILGPKTTAVIKIWQSAHGLVADGLVGPLTKATMSAVQ